MKFTLAIAALVASASATWWTVVPTNSLVGLGVETQMPLDEMFKEIDSNGDGALTIEEVNKAIEDFAAAHDYKLPEGWKAQVKAVYDHVDADNNGKVTMDEIKAAIFHAVDTNDDGKWSLKEVTQAIAALAKEHGVKLRAGWRKDVANAFKEVDTNGDKQVSKKELQAAIEKHGYPDLSDLVA
jgi:Ca2+-binding EF-hand superfamily protein